MSSRRQSGDANLARSRRTLPPAKDFSDDPYWWRLARPRHLPKPALQAAYDVVIIGGGYTGLRAALELSRAGATVLVCEREEAGIGAARRNAGYLGRTLKKSFPELAQALGTAYARRIYQELNDAYQTTWEFIRAEKIECFAASKGRFIAATSPAHLKRLESDYEALHHGLGFSEVACRVDTQRPHNCRQQHQRRFLSNCSGLPTTALRGVGRFLASKHAGDCRKVVRTPGASIPAAAWHPT